MVKWNTQLYVITMITLEVAPAALRALFFICIVAMVKWNTQLYVMITLEVEVDDIV